MPLYAPSPLHHRMSDPRGHSRNREQVCCRAASALAFGARYESSRGKTRGLKLSETTVGEHPGEIFSAGDCEDYWHQQNPGSCQLSLGTIIPALQARDRCAETRHLTSRRIREFCSGVGWQKPAVAAVGSRGFPSICEQVCAGKREIYVSPDETIGHCSKI